METGQTRNSHVPFGGLITYACDPDTFIENKELDPTKTQITVECINVDGVYDIPSQWPNCTETVRCGPPPPTPVNGSITWLNGTDDEVGN